MAPALDATSFLSRSNSEFVGQLYARYLKNPASVDPSWQAYFDGLGDDASDVTAELQGASWAPQHALTRIDEAFDDEARPPRVIGRG